MRNTLNIQFSLETYELIINTLKNSEIAKLARAIVAHQRQDAPERFLTSTELRRAFSLLLRDNGETPTFPVPSVTSVRSVPSVKTKQNQKKPKKKKNFPPHPPIEEKKIINNFSLISREREQDEKKRTKEPSPMSH